MKVAKYYVGDMNPFSAVVARAGYYTLNNMWDIIQWHYTV